MPKAPFSGPDVGGSLEWFKKFANTQAKDIKLLTHHYYRVWGKDSTSTMKKLLRPDSSWKKRLKELQQISQKEGVPYRINETNSFSGGGRLGVSDTFGSSLWCLDYMFLLASHGSEGVNLETSINQHAWISHYSPIVRNTSGDYTIRPAYYSMLTFSMGSKGQMVKLDMTQTKVNLSAYTTKDYQNIFWITIINKDFKRDASLKILLPKKYSRADVLLMYAEALNENGKTSKALTYLNMVHERAGLEDYSGLSQGEVRKKVYLERRKELFLEGSRWFDLVRTGRALEVMEPFGMKSYQTVFPIPQDQIDVVNDPSVFAQNEGY